MSVFQAFCDVLDWSKGVGLDGFTATIHMNGFSHSVVHHSGTSSSRSENGFYQKEAGHYERHSTLVMALRRAAITGFGRPGTIHRIQNDTNFPQITATCCLYSCMEEMSKYEQQK
jgi:hypothetical protein